METALREQAYQDEKKKTAALLTKFFSADLISCNFVCLFFSSTVLYDLLYPFQIW